MKEKARVQRSGSVPYGEVPWAVHLLASRVYNERHPQTAERLEERGGFCWAELIACLRGSYDTESIMKASKELDELSK